MRKVLRSVAAIVAGYAAIVFGTTLTFEVLLGGIGYSTSSAPELAIASFGALVSGLVGGFLAAGVAGRAPVWHAAGVLIPLTADTTFVLTSGVSVDPLWFDLSGSLTLMVAALLGGMLWRWLGLHRATAPA